MSTASNSSAGSAPPPRFGAHPCFVLTADTEFGRNPRIEHFTGVLLKPLTYDKLVKVLAA